MPLPKELNQPIVEFLTGLPNIQDANAQRALVLRAGFDAQLQQQIVYGGAPGQFMQLLVSTLYDYGTLANGRDALDVLLETARGLVGGDKQRECDRLIQALQAFRQSQRPASPSTPLPPAAPAGSFRQKKRAMLERQLADLNARYEAASQQLLAMLNAADKVTLQNQMNQLEQEIERVEHELGNI